MSWAAEGFDPGNLQAGYTPSWKFFNAFFRAFQERGGYIEGAEKADKYDDLFLTGSQIGATELMSKLNTFNGFVRGTIDFNGSQFNLTDGTDWYKQSTWDQIVAFQAERVDVSSRQRTLRGLTVIDLDVWDEEALRELLTDVVYDMIFGSGSNQKFFDTRYWGGLYKLLNQVLLHRELSINYFFDPNPTQPYLVINKGETSQFSGFELSEVVSKSINESTKFNNGVSSLGSSGVSTQTTYIKHPGQDEPTIRKLASAGYSGNRQEPFCKSPTKMDIQLLLWVNKGDTDSNVENSGLSGESTGIGIAEQGPPLFSSQTINVINGLAQDAVYVPNRDAFFSNIAQNPHFPISFSPETGTATISLASIVDLRTGSSVTQPPSAVGEPEGNKAYSSILGHTQSNTNLLNMAFCSLPQGDFEFPAE